MSDSDDPLSNNLFTFQNETAVSAWGPNTNASNITGFNFRSNVLSSTMQMPRNFMLQRYAGSNYDQRSMYRRETSPMSTDMMQREFNNSYYQRGKSSQRSVFNCRSGSPASAVRSIDTSASVSAVDIAMAFKSMEFNKYDLRIIKEAYNKFMKQRIRKKVEKRRNRRLFIKANTRRSGGESGEQGSDSSSSSDDRSIRTSHQKENLSSCRSVKTDISDLRQKFKRSSQYRDLTDKFRYKSVMSQRSMIAGPTMPSFRSRPVPANWNNMQKKPTAPVMLQKERFNNKFVLPSQRFNQPVAPTIPENAVDDNHHERNNMQNGPDSDKNRHDNIGRNIETDSDEDEIFFESTSKQMTTNIHRKRNVDSDDDVPTTNRKKARITSPRKYNIETKKPMPKEPANNNDKMNDFVFAKPTFPVRKPAKEKLISKSGDPTLDTQEQTLTIPPINTQKSQPQIQVEQEMDKDIENDQPNVTQNTTDLSMRPSFIKRKLFTQRLEVAEKNNISAENLNSPQNSIYSGIQKEKHKARKLQQVSTQSCLSRDVVQDDSNLLDLIQKIVPLDQMNVTNQVNKTDVHGSKNKVDDDEKWDITSVITERNDDKVSETYTDEEVFNATVKKLVKENDSKMPSPIKVNSCKILVERLPPNFDLTQTHKLKVTNDVASKRVQKSVKTFWDTDSESEAECQPLSRNHSINLKENRRKEAPQPETQKFQGISTMFDSKKSAASTSNTSTYVNNSFIHKFNNTTLRIRSHRTPKRGNQTRDEDAKSDVIITLSNKQKTFHTNSCIEPSKPEHKTKTELQNKKKTAIEPQQQNKKSPKGKKKASKTDVNSVKALTPQKQTKNNNNNDLNKTGQSETKTKDNKKVVIQNEQGTNKEISKNKRKNTQSVKNSNNKTADTNIEKQINNKKTAQSKQKSNNQKKDLFENEQQIEKQPNRNDKDKLVQDDTKTKKQTNNKKSAKTQSKYQKTPKKTKNIENNSSLNESNTEHKNISTRAVRSCRSSKRNETLDKSNRAMNRTLRSRSRLIDQTFPLNGNLKNSSVNESTLPEDNNNCRTLRSSQNAKLNETTDISLNGSGNRTLRSRQIDLSSTLKGNLPRAKQKVNNVKDSKSRLSNISFSIPAENKAVSKPTKSRLFKAHDIETSDVSFSLLENKLPTPKKTMLGKSRLNAKAGKKENGVIKFTPLKQIALRGKEMFVSKNELRPNRNRVPNKRYLIS